MDLWILFRSELLTHPVLEVVDVVIFCHQDAVLVLDAMQTLLIEFGNKSILLHHQFCEAGCFFYIDGLVRKSFLRE